MNNRNDYLEDFKNAIRAAGLMPPDCIPAGKIITFPGADKPKSNKAARCFLFPDRRGGWFMDYTTGLFEVWQAKRDKPYSEAERAAFREQCERDRKAREAEEKQRYDAAAKQAAADWRGYQLATSENPCLIKKKIQQPYGAKTGAWRVWVDGNHEFIADSLILPLFDASLKLRSLQAIFPEKHPVLGRDKDFLAGGQKRGCFYWLGKKSETVLIAEGFSTAASLYEATGNQVFIAFDAGNLVNVAKIVRAKRPDAEIIIMGDNDLSGTGQDAARAAALACGGKYLIPPEPGTDWNDVISGKGAK